MLTVKGNERQAKSKNRTPKPSNKRRVPGGSASSNYIQKNILFLLQYSSLPITSSVFFRDIGNSEFKKRAAARRGTGYNEKAAGLGAALAAAYKSSS
jgi:hypothetical protein